VGPLSGSTAVISSAASASVAYTSYRSQMTLPLSMTDRDIERMLRDEGGSLDFV
jgi:hypothetical protein